MKLILASASPRRRALLESAGFTFDVRAVDVDEQREADEPPSVYVRRLAREKSALALAALASQPDADVVVIGADTAVVVDGDVLGKPQSPGAAGRMLQRLSGRAHEVLTGVSLRTPFLEIGCVDTTVVHLRTLSPEEIGWYVETGEGIDKAGAYAIQGRAGRFIPRIEGSYSNVVGLPISAVCALLAELGKSSGSGCIQKPAELC
jgi:septum formation protein